MACVVRGSQHLEPEPVNKLCVTESVSPSMTNAALLWLKPCHFSFHLELQHSAALLSCREHTVLLFNCAEKPLTSANARYFDKKSMHFLKGPICDISKGYIGIKLNRKIMHMHVFGWIKSPKMNNCSIFIRHC